MEQLQLINLEKILFVYQGRSYVNAVQANVGYSGFYRKSQIARKRLQNTISQDNNSETEQLWIKTSR